MLYELCKELRNWFETDIVLDVFTIQDGELQLADDSFIKTGQYIRIVGSTFNDGVYTYPVNGLQDETFDGAIWLMAVPPAVVNLASEIEGWCAKYADTLNSPYTSESFGGYSYSKAASASGKSSVPTWKDVFATRMSPWRKI